MPSAGCAAPRALGNENGTLNVATPVESWVEKLSPMPSMLPAPLGIEMALPVTPLLSPPVGSAAGARAALSLAASFSSTFLVEAALGSGFGKCLANTGLLSNVAVLRPVALASDAMPLLDRSSDGASPPDAAAEASV